MKKIISFLVLILSVLQIAAQPAMDENVTWSKASEILSRITAPNFPARDYLITDFGAIEGGRVNCTEAFRKAIDKCNKEGGGRVVVPKGTFLTGAIHLKSNVNLHIGKGSKLIFSTDPNDYLPAVYSRWEGIECYNYSPFIYAFEQENIAVTGEGILDGSASDQNWWSWALKNSDGKSKATPDVKLLNEMSEKGILVEQRIFGDGHYLRPNFFVPYRSKNVLIEDLTILRSPMWEINPVLCTNVIVRNLKITTHGPNNDGCDPESSRDVLIENCLFDAGDDCIAIKAGRNDDGRRVGAVSENLIIRNCTMKDGHAGVAIGSEIAGGCRNVFIEDCKMDSPNLERALRFKSNARRGGIVENIFMRNIEIGEVAEALLTIDFLYEEGPNGSFPPTVRNVQIENVNSKSSPRLFFIKGFKGATIDEIRVSNSNFAGVKATEVIEHAGRIELDNVTIEPLIKVHSLSSRQVPK